MSISVMIKPSSSACNLNCDYCFYNSVASERAVGFKGMLSEDLAAEIIVKAMDFTKGDDIFFTFQGGEPLLRGIDFYKNFVKMLNENNNYNSKITLCVQTNATLINDEWCEFFKENNILVGVSLDGDEELNSYRKYPDGSASFSDTLCGINLLKKHKVTYNVLSVLTSRLAQNIRKSYRFFKQNDFHYFQYIPCIRPFGADDRGYAMSVDDFEEYLRVLYKIYFNDNMRGNLVSIRQFDNYALLAAGKSAEQCGMNGPCSTQFVVEGDGSVYPCDFYCTDEWLLGNIKTNNFTELYNSKRAVEFIKESFIVSDECKECKYFALCRGGGCKRTRRSDDYCKAYKKFFDAYDDLIMKMR